MQLKKKCSIVMLIKKIVNSDFAFLFVGRTIKSFDKEFLLIVDVKNRITFDLCESRIMIGRSEMKTNLYNITINAVVAIFRRNRESKKKIFFVEKNKTEKCKFL